MNSRQVSSDFAFLLACLTFGPDVIAAPLPPVPNDWKTILQLAVNHGVASLMYARLKKAKSVPSDVMQDWLGYATSQQLNNHTITVEMHRLNEKFTRAQISPIVFKGPPLVLQLYGSPYTRPFSDIDILVPPEQIPATTKLLIEDGYATLVRKLPTALPRMHYHYNFKHTKHRVVVELHWAVAPPYLRFPLHFEQLWERSVEVTVLDKTVRTPSPEDTLLILCMHGTKHGWVRLSWVYDIAAFVRAYPQMDWHKMLRRADEAHCRRMFLVALHLASDLLNVNLPDPISRAVAEDSHVVRLAEQVKRWLFAPDDSHYFEKHAFQINVRDRIGDKLLYVKVKQPFLDDNAATQISRSPQTDHTLFYLLWVNRLVRKYALRPALRFMERVRRRIRDS